MSRKAEYDSYIHGAAWKVKRIQRLKLDGFRCVRCNSAAKPLHVHHRTYEHLGDEPMADLVTLCASCHARLHKLLDGRPLVSLENMTRRFLGEKIRRSGYRPRFRGYRRDKTPLWKRPAA